MKTKHRNNIRLKITSLLSALLLTTIVSPAIATTSPGPGNYCGTTANDAKTDGVYVWANGNVNCSQAVAKELKVIIQRAELLSWDDFKYGSGNRVYLPGVTTYIGGNSWSVDCNGTGTWKYRSKVVSKNSSNVSKTVIGPEKNLVC